MKAILLGILASFFFAFTFILNRQMNISGGSWVWSASLRYIFMLPFLILIVGSRRNLIPALKEIRKNIFSWLLWSTVGFGLFYAPLSFAASYGPAWLIAGTWQITIIAGSLLSPLFYKVVITQSGFYKVRCKIPFKSLMISSIILIGIGLIQINRANNSSIKEVIIGIVPVLVAAFAYPIGNRKMMEICEGKLDAYQRVFGMTLASMPFWLILSIYGIIFIGAPCREQILQSLIVAICAGVVATILFFSATDITNGDVKNLAAVEATQSGSVIFTLLGEILVFHGKFPEGLSLIGMILIISGMIFHSITS
ncbi:putative multidrug resistance efflux transporter [Fonticella tunisiensis]|uniref:Putative multidrug resistance efflux transporter n=1 Tax=Fonticella tunisiensis TaxID=1096341 RepID=A0A4R7KU61_9CLOT|nr:putative multidrug resistance efflux transporter [Fonticella tunisiensis]